MKGEVFSLLGRPVTVYALCLGAALTLGLILFFRQCKKTKVNLDAAWRAALLALPLALIGARIFYCAARLRLYAEIGFLNVLTMWNGGYALWGAVGGAALAAVLSARGGKAKASALLDAMAPAGALIIAVMRFAEYSIGEGIGPLVEDERFWRFPFAVMDEWEDWYWAVFVLEGVAALVILAVLLRRRRPAGDTARLFLVLYSACQILLESLRRDSVLRWLFVRVSQLTAALVLAGLMIFAVIRWKRAGHNPWMTTRYVILSFAAVVLAVGVIVAMEFAVDGKILVGLSHWGAYGIEGLCAAVMGLIAGRMALKTGKKRIDKRA